ncbi:large conductance mechanosensitive channel protein MscL [Actinomadura parmotrematis]|uniref:Large conductance mechanosensitive channel protein MscL n=1 Tax=Actinomadura parmotrematis TaxID=2864039 RepID=A0ABS7FMV1_9ACTN|nr:large conductance mechanosensitive channel protein MscL [Actinomadura parmotrematis]MBW8481713.1 large conductance mechanosensitive channel protein MscL [Actinomadura parmotrematis]
MSGFKKFLLRGNLIELAVAVVIGAAFTALVNALVKSFITPLIALIGGQPDFDDLSFKVNGTEFPYGLFITAAISFLIIAAVIYFLVVAPTAKLLERMARKEEATTRDCPFCLSEIPLQATRCKDCTMEVAPA